MATTKTKNTATPKAVATSSDAPQNISLPERQPTHVTVVSQVEGFRRAGRAWGKAPTTVPVEDLSDDELAALLREPKLAVVFVCGEVDPC